MEVIKSSESSKSAVGMKFLKKDQTPFQKRIASIALKTGDDITEWMQAGQRKSGNLRTPKYGLRRRPPKFPSPLFQPAASDTPSTLMTGSTSRSTYVTLRGSSITPHKSLVSETPYKQVLSDIPDSRKLDIDLTARSIDLSNKFPDKTPRTQTDSDNKTDFLTPTRSYNLPQKSYSSAAGGKIKTYRDIHQLSESAPLQRTVKTFNIKLRQMSHTGRTRTSMDDGEFNINPEPVPYQPQNFMSSTLLKKVSIPKRHLDSFGGYEYTLGSKRGVILHTDRYQWDAVKSLEGMSQRDRLRAELEYMERLRGIKRRREMLPHRAQLDLLMGGKKVEFSERFDIQREIQKLKSLVMPQNARDLFHGRGFQLPEQHSSIKPRKAPSLDYDSDEDVALSANLQRLPRQGVDPDTGLAKSRFQQNQLPRISNKQNPLGLGSTSPILLAREKRTVDQIKARISVPSEKKGRRPIQIKLHDLVQDRRPGRFSEEGPWTPNISRQGMTPAHLKRSRTNIQNKFEGQMNRSKTLPDADKEKSLKLTTQAETVKRVEIPTVTQVPRSRGAARVDPNPEPEIGPVPSVMETDAKGDLVEGQDFPGDRADTPKSKASERTQKTASPVKAVTPNPLKGSELPETLPESQRNELKEAFKKLDTDSDGHLMYNQLKTQLPKKLSPQQERFLKEVYDITSSSTFFGVEEFMTMSSLTTVVENLKPEATEAYAALDFSTLHNHIVHFVDLFQSVDRGQRGKISIESLQELLTTEIQKDLEENQNLWGAILEVIEPSEAIKVSKIEYLAHIPYFLKLKQS